MLIQVKFFRYIAYFLIFRAIFEGFFALMVI